MIRGSIGKQFVIKHYGRRVIMTKFPDMSGIEASPDQRICRNLFKEAVAYAKTVIADPVRKKEWQKKLRRRNGVYNKAIKEFMLRERMVKINAETAVESSLQADEKANKLLKNITGMQSKIKIAALFKWKIGSSSMSEWTQHAALPAQKSGAG